MLHLKRSSPPSSWTWFGLAPSLLTYRLSSSTTSSDLASRPLPTPLPSQTTKSRITPSTHIPTPPRHVANPRVHNVAPRPPPHRHAFTPKPVANDTHHRSNSSPSKHHANSLSLTQSKSNIPSNFQKQLNQKLEYSQIKKREELRTIAIHFRDFEKVLSVMKRSTELPTEELQSWILCAAVIRYPYLRNNHPVTTIPGLEKAVSAAAKRAKDGILALTVFGIVKGKLWEVDSNFSASTIANIIQGRTPSTLDPLTCAQMSWALAKIYCHPPSPAEGVDLVTIRYALESIAMDCSKRQLDLFSPYSVATILASCDAVHVRPRSLLLAAADFFEKVDPSTVLVREMAATLNAFSRADFKPQSVFEVFANSLATRTDQSLFKNLSNSALTQLVWLFAQALQSSPAVDAVIYRAAAEVERRGVSNCSDQDMARLVEVFAERDDPQASIFLKDVVRRLQASNFELGSPRLVASTVYACARAGSIPDELVAPLGEFVTRNASGALLSLPRTYLLQLIWSFSALPNPNRSATDALAGMVMNKTSQTLTPRFLALMAWSYGNHYAMRNAQVLEWVCREVVNRDMAFFSPSEAALVVSGASHIKVHSPDAVATRIAIAKRFSLDKQWRDGFSVWDLALVLHALVRQNIPYNSDSDGQKAFKNEIEAEAASLIFGMLEKHPINDFSWPSAAETLQAIVELESQDDTLKVPNRRALAENIIKCLGERGSAGAVRADLVLVMRAAFRLSLLTLNSPTMSLTRNHVISGTFVTAIDPAVKEAAHEVAVAWKSEFPKEPLPVWLKGIVA